MMTNYQKFTAACEQAKNKIAYLELLGKALATTGNDPLSEKLLDLAAAFKDDVENMRTLYMAEAELVYRSAQENSKVLLQAALAGAKISRRSRK